ncbi:MAG: hypothetical protein NC041_07150 [Bacteroides sp.]|nr:hypothetical protein [Prevotella sp.]MCM1407074.1 hypothetical protein [Treponema brennaborense]MCM1470226.1 hypothetical protein [Bacteroides sp.]
MKWDFSNPMFHKPKAEKRRRLLQWQEELEHTRSQFGRLLCNTPRTNVLRLDWSDHNGCVDIIYKNGYRKPVMVAGDSATAFMQDILKKIN